MAAELTSRLSARFLFVVGKGGVGKTTTAGALALSLADGGEPTHLLSTDPAHSLRDLFGLDASAREPRASPCTPRLTIEEFDGALSARRWLEEVEAPIAELIERGSYLDREDVTALLGCAAPGMDEVTAALRIAELETSTEHARVVVDTAPTGHTLRLLDCGKVLNGWAKAVGAMAAKAGAVAVALTGRRPRFAGEDVIERLRIDVSRFTDRVLAHADFVVVTRSDDVVVAETERLIQELRGRHLRVSTVVAVGGLAGGRYGSTPVAEVPIGRSRVGCDELRTWGVSDAPPVPRPAAPREARAADPLTLVPARPLMLFAGKGGVGKTTCSAAYAVALSQKHDVLLLSTDPAGSLGDVFGEPVDSAGTSINPRLVARQLDADAEYARFRSTHRKRIRDVFQGLGLKDSAPLDRDVLESIIDMAPPGLDEIFAVQAILDGPGEREVLVLDTAPTGHFLRLLEMPQIALDWTHTLLRVLLKYRSVLGLDGLAQDLLEWARGLKRLLELLRDQQHTGVVIVTLPEALALHETDRLLATLGEGTIPVAAVIRNRWTAGSRALASELHPSASSPTVTSPLVSAPPVGADRLLAFARSWEGA